MLLKPAVRVAKSVSFVITLMAVLLLAHAPRAQEHALTAHHGFGDVAHWTSVFESADRAKWQKPDGVVRALNLKPGQTVIDIGAGSGYFTRRFAKAVGPSGTVIGLDVEMVDYMKTDARKLGLQNYHARVVKADDPELSPNSADVIFFCDTLHHVDERLAYLRKLAPALKPGGRIAVVDFKKNAPEGLAIRRRSRNSAKPLFLTSTIACFCGNGRNMVSGCSLNSSRRTPGLSRNTSSGAEGTCPRN
jgi:ubiquinone/menaquinone biosynthesis C-methylase UbiE